MIAGKVLKILRENPTRVHCYVFHYVKLFIKAKLASKKISDNNAHNTEMMYKLFNVDNETSLNELIKLNNKQIFLTKEIDKVINLIMKDKKIHQEVINSADLVLKDTFQVLNFNVKDMFDYKSNHYKWLTDYKTGQKYKLSYYTKVNSYNKIANSDIKRVWEIARMQYLFAPSIAYYISKEEKYAKKVQHIISDFIDQNPVGYGPNWNVSMEVGIRVANMVLAYELIQDSKCLSDSFHLKFYSSLYEHYKHISRNKENVAGKTYNHYLGNLLGIATCNAILPIDNYGKIKKFLEKSLIREFDRQILNDGSNFEGSSYYHCLALELFAYTILVARNFNLKLPSQYYDKLLLMADYINEFVLEDGYLPQIGDNDSGFVFNLCNINMHDRRYIIDIIYEHLLGKKLKYKNNNILTALFTGVIDKIYDNSRNKNDKYKILLYEDAGVSRISSDKIFMMISAIDAQRFQLGSHTHNDSLAFELLVDGKPFIVDPGTGSYTGNTKIRNQLRSVLSHSTISIDGEEQKKICNGSVFDWNSRVATKLYVSTNDKVLMGEIKLNKKQRHQREFILTNSNEITIIDKIYGEMNSLQCNLVLYPNLNIGKIVSGNYIEIYDEYYKMIIQGSWEYKVEDWIYSPQYDVVVPCKKIVAFSNNRINKMIINIASIK